MKYLVTDSTNPTLAAIFDTKAQLYDTLWKWVPESDIDLYKDQFKVYLITPYHGGFGSYPIATLDEEFFDREKSLIEDELLEKIVRILKTRFKSNHIILVDSKSTVETKYENYKKENNELIDNLWKRVSSFYLELTNSVKKLGYYRLPFKLKTIENDPSKSKVVKAFIGLGSEGTEFELKGVYDY